MKGPLSVWLALVVSVGTTPVRGAGYNPRAGERHAEFTLPSIADGKPVSLSDYRGKKVLLIQFASW